MELNIEELKKQKRPLWMTSLGVKSTADLLGGGEGIHKDRLPVNSVRSAGEEGLLTVEGFSMINLACGREPAKLGMRTWEGCLHITAYLDHLDACEKCSQAKGILIDELNKVIGGEKGLLGSYS